ncbi:hypothetical protein EJB05_37747 [Eragrostis curvula]|uniref:Uncharacterized protein n=1 Tax=Eragrostis curvula TaxID=38414 RepID=A0A5J9TSC9_9POAL|nr:hypothetical protein EJB05_37747 [Eragrostis curvula]
MLQGRDIRRSVNDIGNVVAFPAGQPDGESRLRAAMERLQRRLRRVAASCFVWILYRVNHVYVFLVLKYMGYVSVFVKPERH